MSTSDPKRGSMRETMIAAIVSLALGTATMATFGTMALAHGGVGRGGHFSGFSGHFAGDHFGRGFRGGFGRLHEFGGGPYYGFGYGYGSCYVLTPAGYVSVCY
jgi:hypothetical protein